jgi:hypothetical protein
MSSATPTVKKENLDILATVDSELDRWRNILFFSMDNQEGANNQSQLLFGPNATNPSTESPAEAHPPHLPQLRHVTPHPNAPYDHSMNPYQQLEQGFVPSELHSLQFDPFQAIWLYMLGHSEANLSIL